MIKRRLHKRLSATRSNSFEEYFQFLIHDPSEINELIDVLTINVSEFFRNPFVFDFFYAYLFPQMIFKKIQNNNPYIRVWSAGCACGEEPFSLAMMFHELLEKENIKLDLKFFATDVDLKSLKCAKDGIYNFEKIKKTRFGLLRKYFEEQNGKFQVISKIRNMVKFSFYDLMEKKSFAPPESIYGDFDLVLCRNVLIYFNMDAQEQIFLKLFHSLTPGGYLILGESEVIPNRYIKYFRKSSEFSKIFYKI